MGFIWGPPNALEIQGRRKVSDKAAATKLEEELTKKLTDLKESGKEVVISDLDLSQNHVPAEFFETIFSTVSSQNIPVQRLRLFGIPTMTDEAVVHLAEYLKSVPAEAAPFELHLSDCALTSVGFTALIEAIEENSAFPCQNPATKKTQPLYMRLENNYIEPATMQEKVDAKVIKIFLRDKPLGKIEGEEKVYLVKKQNQVGFSQKEGEPPSPEDVKPVRTQVFDWKFRQEQQRKEASQWMWVPSDMWQPQWQKPPQTSWTKPQQTSWTKPLQTQWQKPQQSTWSAKGKGMEKGKAAAPKALIQPQKTVPIVSKGGSKGGTVGVGDCKWCMKGECWTHGGGKGAKGVVTKGGKGVATTPVAAAVGGKNANDRSRTPAPRASKGAPAQPVKPPPGKKSTLPHPWQEQFSDEFQIPYYWNPETQESSWEVPTA
eukprot:CAMPEP_0169134950 /NCGR_PEP_ID=MMETSP1015-20121227/40173_1 /TAXON_ID=342587 /ORGANISM="Karlodinium micrum, Strain CCMP2283" /LENGTH=430 /DNA_ID=CAMNT_0009199551 /DNA_START=44 /DNA_END=1336 /DNA_ORIENTATION=+